MDLKIVGKQINLRKLKKSDARSIYQHVNDKTISRFTTIPHPYTLKMAYDFIKITNRNMRKKNAFGLGIELKGTHTIIGMISLMKKEHNKRSSNSYSPVRF